MAHAVEVTRQEGSPQGVDHDGRVQPRHDLRREETGTLRAAESGTEKHHVGAVGQLDDAVSAGHGQLAVAQHRKAFDQGLRQGHGEGGCGVRRRRDLHLARAHTQGGLRGEQDRPRCLARPADDEHRSSVGLVPVL